LQSWCPPISFGGHHRCRLGRRPQGWDDRTLTANLPQAAVQIIVGAMQSHQAMATKLLSDESTRGVFLDVVYELLKRDSGGELFKAVR
ncbi:hypothetical protein, partial [Aquabacterium sp. A08]|uniref:hypothetical protein n=1 Tax=Aquabacterium sp. A08 TaxID=2718532 RepID=UPI001FBC01CA